MILKYINFLLILFLFPFVFIGKLNAIQMVEPLYDTTHQVEQTISSTSSDTLLIPSKHITRAQAKRFKETLNGLIKDIWIKQLDQKFTIVNKDLSIIQTTMEDFLG